MKATATNPRTGKIEACKVLPGYHLWQDGVIFVGDSAPHDSGHVYGRNELPDLTES